MRACAKGYRFSWNLDGTPRWEYRPSWWQEGDVVGVGAGTGEAFGDWLKKSMLDGSHWGIGMKANWELLLTMVSVMGTWSFFVYVLLKGL